MKVTQHKSNVDTRPRICRGLPKKRPGTDWTPTRHMELDLLELHSVQHWAESHQHSYLRMDVCITNISLSSGLANLPLQTGYYLQVLFESFRPRYQIPSLCYWTLPYFRPILTDFVLQRWAYKVLMLVLPCVPQGVLLTWTVPVNLQLTHKTTHTKNQKNQMQDSNAVDNNIAPQKLV